MHLRNRMIGAAMSSLMAVSCSAGPEHQPAQKVESIAACLPETANITELNVRTVSEAVNLSICIADRIALEDARELSAFLRTAAPAEATFDDTTATYRTVTEVRARNGLRIAFIGPEHIGSPDVLFGKLADAKNPVAGELTKDNEDNPLLLLSHPTLVSPSVMAYGIIHFGFHAMRESSCVQEETEVLRLLTEAFRSTDSRNRAWLQHLVTSRVVQTVLDPNGQLQYTFDANPEKMVAPPQVSDDRNPKSYMNYDLWRTTSMIVSAIMDPASTPAEQQAKIHAEASRHCENP